MRPSASSLLSALMVLSVSMAGSRAEVTTFGGFTPDSGAAQPPAASQDSAGRTLVWIPLSSKSVLRKTVRAISPHERYHHGMTAASAWLLRLSAGEIREVWTATRRAWNQCNGLEEFVEVVAASGRITLHLPASKVPPFAAEARRINERYAKELESILGTRKYTLLLLIEGERLLVPNLGFMSGGTGQRLAEGASPEDGVAPTIGDVYMVLQRGRTEAANDVVFTTLVGDQAQAAVTSAGEADEIRSMARGRNKESYSSSETVFGILKVPWPSLADRLGARRHLEREFLRRRNQAIRLIREYPDIGVVVTDESGTSYIGLPWRWDPMGGTPPPITTVARPGRNGIPELSPYLKAVLRLNEAGAQELARYLDDVSLAIESYLARRCRIKEVTHNSITVHLDGRDFAEAREVIEAGFLIMDARFGNHTSRVLRPVFSGREPLDEPIDQHGMVTSVDLELAISPPKDGTGETKASFQMRTTRKDGSKRRETSGRWEEMEGMVPVFLVRLAEEELEILKRPVKP